MPPARPSSSGRWCARRRRPQRPRPRCVPADITRIRSASDRISSSSNRHDQHRTARVPAGDQLAADEFMMAPISTPRGRLPDHQQKPGMARHLARQDQLLLVAAGEARRQQGGCARPARRTGPSARRSVCRPPARRAGSCDRRVRDPGSRGWRFPTPGTPAPAPAAAGPPARAPRPARASRRGPRDGRHRPFGRRLPARRRSAAGCRQDLEKLALAVARDAGDTDDLAGEPRTRCRRAPGLGGRRPATGRAPPAAARPCGPAPYRTRSAPCVRPSAPRVPRRWSSKVARSATTSPRRITIITCRSRSGSHAACG